MRYRELMEAVRYNNQTGNLEIDFDPATITTAEFKQMSEALRRGRDEALAFDYIVNGETFGTMARCVIFSPCCSRGSRRNRRSATWRREYPELAGVVDLVPPKWLYRLRGNTLRIDVTELMADIDRNGMLWPVIILVGKEDRRARIGEGNHRIEAALRLNLDAIPARVIVQQREHGRPGFSHDVSADLLIPEEGYVPSDMRPSKVFRSLAGLTTD